MKKYIWFACMVIVIACDQRLKDTIGEKTSQKTQQSEFNEQFVISIGQTVTIESEGLNIRFDSVPMDCRCPSGAQCIWAGYAEIILNATNSNNESVRINLTTSYPGQQTASFFSYTVELLELTPYPIVDQQTDSTTYQASLIVKKAVVQ